MLGSARVERKDNQRQGNNSLGQTEGGPHSETDKGQEISEAQGMFFQAYQRGCGWETRPVLTGREGREQIDRQEGVGSHRQG